MQKQLYNYLHKKANEMDITILCLGNSIKLWNPNPRHIIKIEDIIATADIQYGLKRYMDNGTYIAEFNLL